MVIVDGQEMLGFPLLFQEFLHSHYDLLYIPTVFCSAILLLCYHRSASSSGAFVFFFKVATVTHNLAAITLFHRELEKYLKGISIHLQI